MVVAFLNYRYFPKEDSMYRRKNRAIVTSCSFLAILVLLLAACGPSGTTTSPSSSTSTKPVRGGTWTDDLYEDTSSLIPNGSVETYSFLVEQSIWAPLFLGTPTGQITPGLVQEVPTSTNGDISSDLKTWTFKLRPGLKWSDGQPLTAQDVDYTWKLWTNPSFGAASTVGYSYIKSTTISHNNLWITFHLSQPFSPFLSVWVDGAVSPIPQHIFGKMKPGDILKSSQNLDPTVTSGPFTLTTSRHGTEYVVTRNPNYYLASQGLPYLDSIVFRIVPDQDTILKDFQSGSINSSWFLDVTKTSTYQKLSNYSIVKAPVAANFEAIYFNMKNPVLQDVNIRKAVSMAVNQSTLIQVARHGQAAPLCTDHATAYNPGYQKDITCPKYDPAAAKTLLQSDGWKMGSDNIFAKNGKKLEFQYSTTANNAWRAEDEDILQQELAAIGIKLNITNYPASTFFGTFLPQGQIGKYDIAEFENSYTYDADDATGFSCAQIPSAANSYGGANFSFYCNHTLDNLFTQEQSTADLTARQNIFNQIHQIYLTDYPFVTEYAPIDIALVKSTGHNYAIGSEGASETVNVMNWWCTGGKC
ncbi:MAG: peptide ABC transporter substrate-binding protein [Ktedonobacteraceae bacterium]|nr:peptide ABC transporter substrate-binding protein [Ktedonobacteraceae bacterium]